MVPLLLTAGSGSSSSRNVDMEPMSGGGFAAPQPLKSVVDCANQLGRARTGSGRNHVRGRWESSQSCVEIGPEISPGLRACLRRVCHSVEAQGFAWSDVRVIWPSPRGKGRVAFGTRHLCLVSTCISPLAGFMGVVVRIVKRARYGKRGKMEQAPFSPPNPQKSFRPCFSS